MKRRAFLTVLTSTTALAGGMAQAEQHLQTSYFPTDAAQTCDVSLDSFTSDWTKITFPTVEGNPLSGQTIGPFYDADTGLVYVFPPDGPGFMSSSTTPSNCSFFQWSAQMFLWMTSTINDGGSIPATPAAPSDATPYVFSSEFFYRLTDFTTLQPQSNSGPSNGMLALRATKPDHPVDTIGQAGRTSGVLFTQDSTDVSNDSSLVYYDILSNRPYGYVRDAVNTKAAAPYNFTEFPDSAAETCDAIDYGFANGFVKESGISTILKGLFCPSPSIAAMAMTTKMPDLATSAGIIPQLETAIDFLSMTIEVKTSWVLANSLAHPERYIVQKNTIPTFMGSETGSEMIQNGSAEDDLALVGAHIVGSVNGHPEMIWATFEHMSNSPNVEYFYVDGTGATKSHTDIATANGQWLISDGTSTGANTEYAVTGSTNGTNTIVQSSSNTDKPVNTPSNINRINPWGSSPTREAAATNSEVISTNMTVLDALAGFYAANGGAAVSDPRLNYILTGASWGNNGAFPTGSDVSEIVGTPAMANTTMETFQQTDVDANGDKNGCFTCHGISASEGGFDISHIFGGISTVEE